MHTTLPEYRSGRFHLTFLAEASQILSRTLDCEAVASEAARLQVPLLADGCVVDLLDSGVWWRAACTHADEARAALLAAASIEIDGELPADLAPFLEGNEPQRLLHHAAQAPQASPPARSDTAREPREDPPAHGPGEPRRARLGGAPHLSPAHASPAHAIAPDPPLLRRLTGAALDDACDALALPLHAGGRPIGVLTLLCDVSGRRLGDQDVALAAELARRVGTAIDNSRLYREAERARAEAEASRQRSQFLSSISDVLAGAVALPDVLLQTARLATTELGACCIVEFEGPPEAGRQRVLAHQNLALEAQLRAALQAQPRVLEALLADHAVAAHREAHRPRWPRRGDDAQAPARGAQVDDTDPGGRATPHTGPAVPEGPRPAALPEGAAPPAGARGDAPHGAGAFVDLLEPAALLTLPLFVREAPAGQATFVRTQAQPGRFTGDDVLLAEELLRRAAGAIDRAWLFYELEAAVRVRDEFLSIASHELRTPLTALELQLGNLARISQRPDPARWQGRLQEKLHSASRQTLRLGKLIDNLLDVSRIGAGTLALERAPMRMDALVADVIERLRDEALAAGCALQLVCPAPVAGSWDALRLEQVLVNLLVNAIKYGAGQPIVVSLRQSRGTMVLGVRDGGIGITQDALERIFGRFERAVSARAFGGLGLGLFISRQIVVAHGGRIHVRSTPGEGAYFEVCIPCETDEPERAQSGSPPPPPSGLPFGSP